MSFDWLASTCLTRTSAQRLSSTAWLLSAEGLRGAAQSCSDEFTEILAEDYKTPVIFEARCAELTRDIEEANRELGFGPESPDAVPRVVRTLSDFLADDAGEVAQLGGAPMAAPASRQSPVRMSVAVLAGGGTVAEDMPVTAP